MKHVTLFFLLPILLIARAHSQDNQTLAKSAYLNAESSYNKGEFSEAYDYTEEAIELLGATNSRLEYLRVKLFLAVKNWGGADQELKKFFEVTPPDSYPEEKYNEMVEAIAFVKKKAELEELEYQKLNKRREQQEQATLECFRSNNASLISAYLNEYNKAYDSGEAYEIVSELKEINDKIEVLKNKYGNYELCSLYMGRAALYFNYGMYTNAKNDAQEAFYQHVTRSSLDDKRKRTTYALRFTRDWNFQLMANEEEGVPDYFLDKEHGLSICNMIATNMYFLKEYQSADAIFTRILLLDDDDSYAFAYLYKDSIKAIQPNASNSTDEDLFKFMENINSNKNYEAYLAYGNYRWRMNDFSGAEKAFTRYIEKAPESKSYIAYWYRAYIKLKEKKYNEAMTDFCQDAKNINCMYYGGIIQHIYLDREIQAKGEFSYILENYGESDYAPFSAYYLGNNEKAISLIEKQLSGIGAADTEKLKRLYYNYACLLSLMNRQTDAIEKLRLSFSNGWSDFWWIEHDDDFDNIRTLPAFKKLVDSYKGMYFGQHIADE